MKLQGVGIIFALIVLPIILVMSYYIQLQVDTLIIQKEYDSKLLDSTYDAMSAFELNTANEDLSTVSDSLRTIVEASSNLFYTTLATNMGVSNASKSYIEPFIPALLFTMYDGYYICAPTQVPKILTNTDGVAVTVGDLGVSTSGNGTYTYNSSVYDQYKAFTNNETGATNPELDANNYLSIENITSENYKLDYAQILYYTNVDGVYTADITKAKMTTKNIVKCYMPYSARYKQDDMDVTVNYTLDNFVTIEGSKGDLYYSKSGYLIPDDSVKIKVKDAEGRNVEILKFNQEQAQQYIESGNYKVSVDIIQEVNGAEEVTATIVANNINVPVLTQEIESLNKYVKDLKNITTADDINQVKALIDTINDHPDVGDYGLPLNFNDATTIIRKTVADLNKSINKKQYDLDKVSAAVYYIKAQIFTDWLQETFGDIVETSVVEVAGQDYQIVGTDFATDEVIYKFSDSAKIFDLTALDSSGNRTDREEDISAGVTEIAKSSTFYNHKHNVIRNSLQYNLNLAMSTYNASAYVAGYDYQMPVMQNEEWEAILNNVSIVSFMQGVKCGLKTYNNYKVVSSTNNEIVVKPEHIFYVLKNEFNNEESEYHRIDCKKLEGLLTSNTDEFRSFSSKEVKYDKLYDRNRVYAYTYDHMNLACYDCINDYNNEKIDIFDRDGDKFSDYLELRNAYYIALGKERNNIYKMNAFVNSQGYEMLYNKDADIVSERNSLFDLNHIKAIEIIVEELKATDANESSIVISPKLKDGANLINLTDSTYSVSPNSTVNQTIYIDVKPNINSTKHVSFGNLFIELTQEQSTLVYDNMSENKTDPTLPPTIADYKALKNDIFKSYIRSVRIIYK